MRTDRTRPTTEQAEARLLADIAAAKASHTRGPWHAGETVYRDGVAIISIIDDSDSPHDIIRNGETSLIHNADANARLIAAAPDLLAALRPFADEYAGPNAPCHDGINGLAKCVRCARIFAARAAIAKAGGVK